MNKHAKSGSILTLVTCTLVAAGWSSLTSAEEQFSVSVRVDTSAEHNSNVSVSELETATGESDSAFVLDFAVDAQWQPRTALNLDFGYNYSDRRYREFSDFDLAMHLLYGDLSYDFNDYTVGGNYYYADAQLGGDGFMELHQRSLYIARLFADAWYVRTAVVQSDKTFATLASRDADTIGLTADAFYFFNQGRSFLLFGANYDDEDARIDAFSYQGTTFRLRYSHRFSIWNRDARMQLGYRWHTRDYRGITPEIEQRRDDRHQVLEARFELPVLDKLSVISLVERGDYRSNLDSADYNETRVSLGLRLAF